MESVKRGTRNERRLVRDPKMADRIERIRKYNSLGTSQ